MNLTLNEHLQIMLWQSMSWTPSWGARVDLVFSPSVIDDMQAESSSFVRSPVPWLHCMTLWLDDTKVYTTSLRQPRALGERVRGNLDCRKMMKDSDKTIKWIKFLWLMSGSTWILRGWESQGSWSTFRFFLKPARGFGSKKEHGS